LRSLLLLRTPKPAEPVPLTGNLLLNHLAGAELRFITPEQYQNRAALLARAASEAQQRGEVAYVIPEGGSNGLGALGYVAAVEELAEQQLQGELPRDLDVIGVACGSGGTAAGVALGLGRFPDVARRALAVAVCDDCAYFERAIAGIVARARALDPSLPEPGALEIRDDFKGPGYGVPTGEQLEFLLEVAGVSGLILEPTYTAKALFGLSRLSPKPRRALFVHTGGLPGLLAEPELIARASARGASGS
jgi:D-cysteine desulfhydrase